MTAPSPGRAAALDRLARQADRFPDLDFVESADAGPAGSARLDARDAALSRAIEHAVVRRWLTLAAICRASIDRRWENVDSRIQAALMAAAAQLLLFGQQADHAVVDDTVEWTKQKGRRGAPGFVNAVLRRIASLRGDIRDGAATTAATVDRWHDRQDVLPLEDGRVLELTRAVFSADHVTRLSEQASHGEDLLLHWMNTAGRATAVQRAAHGLVHAPITVTGLPADALRQDGPFAQHLTAHASQGFWVWSGGHAALLELLGAHPGARVQDSGSGQPARLSKALRCSLILDACAGRGTKTKQLAELHPNAEVVATDTDPKRLRALAEAFAGHERVKVTTPEGLRRVVGKCDLLLLDVPCSNTGVLARRPEARYRFSRRRLDTLVALQRSIVQEHIPFLAPGGHVLFSTCSLESVENERQAEWLAKRVRGRPAGQERREPAGLPGDAPAQYSDGSFGTLVAVG